MTQLTNNALIEETRQLVGTIKRNYLHISANLFRIHEAWTGTVDEWVSFYEQDLELHKSQVSKMLKVGAFVLAHNMLKESVSYEKLYLSINAHKGEDPKLILAEAQSWHSSDYKAQAKEDCNNPEFGTYCKNCWSSKENHA